MNSGRAEVRAAHGELVEPLNGLNDLNVSSPPIAYCLLPIPIDT